MSTFEEIVAASLSGGDHLGGNMKRRR